MKLLALLDRLPLMPLAVFAVLLALAPFWPSAHLYDKLVMLADGTLVKSEDIFDLIMHSAPLALLAAKLLRMQSLKNEAPDQ